MDKKYRSEAMASVHETMEALHKVGAIGKQTMRRFDDACLTQVQALSPKQIKALRGAGAREPDRLRELPQCDAEPGKQVGARRKEALRPGSEAPVFSREARHQGGGLKLLWFSCNSGLFVMAAIGRGGPWHLSIAARRLPRRNPT